MFEFSRSSSAEAERPEPFSQEGPSLWSASLRSWDLCFCGFHAIRTLSPR